MASIRYLSGWLDKYTTAPVVVICQVEPLASSADFDARVAAAVDARVDAAVAVALRAHGVSPPPTGSTSPGRRSPLDEAPPLPSRALNLKTITYADAVRECMATAYLVPYILGSAHVVRLCPSIGSRERLAQHSCALDVSRQPSLRPTAEE